MREAPRRYVPDTQFTMLLTVLAFAAIAGILALIGALVYATPVIVTDGGAIRYGLMGGDVSEYKRRHGARAVQLRALDELRAFSVQADPCYGSCPAFTLTVRRDGRATIDWSYPRPAIRSSAVVPWGDVLLLLTTADIDGLDPYYPRRGVDTPGAHLELRFAKGVSRVDAPDAFSWPPQIFAVLRGTCVVVNRARWRPPIRRFTCW